MGTAPMWQDCQQITDVDDAILSKVRGKASRSRTATQNAPRLFAAAIHPNVSSVRLAFVGGGDIAACVVSQSPVGTIVAASTMRTTVRCGARVR